MLAPCSSAQACVIWSVLSQSVGSEGAVEQRDAADEGRLEACGSILVGTVIVNQSKVVRPSQLIASVRQLLEGRKRSRRAHGII
jgi:hypothetical protein